MSRAGAAIFVLESGPLLTVIALGELGVGDPSPNPIGFGILAAFTFRPGVVLMILAAMKGRKDRPAEHGVSRRGEDEFE